jgi:HK97 family phage prohead protease
MENNLNNNDIEVRYATELRADSNNNMVYGTAIVFNSESILMGGKVREVVKPSAATAEFLAQQEIVMKYNHQPDSVLAKYSPNAQRNSLKFSVDSVGVHFEFRAKKGDQYILDSINAGDISACSFAFRAADAGNTLEKRSDGTYLRTLNKLDKVADFSLVISPAYEQTSVSVRGLNEFIEAEELAKIKAVEAEKVIVDNSKVLQEAEEKRQREAEHKKYMDEFLKKYLPNIHK